MGVLIQVIWPQGFFNAICWFFVLRPFLFKDLIETSLLPFFQNRFQNGPEAVKLLDSLLPTVGFVLAVGTIRSAAFAYGVVRYLVVYGSASWWGRALVSVAAVVVAWEVLGKKLLSRQAQMRLSQAETRWIYAFANLSFRAWIGCYKAINSPPISSVAAGFHMCIRALVIWTLGMRPIESLSEFTYDLEPLIEHLHIRVLRLNRKIPFLGIQAGFVTVPVSDPPAYDCISYVWGSETQKLHQIRLNGARLPVTANVHQILHGMSSYWKTTYIWIDTICINQENSAEKSQQVRLMNRIYANCRRVFVCLGDPDGARLALSLLVELRMIRLFQHPSTWVKTLSKYWTLREEMELAASR